MEDKDFFRILGMEKEDAQIAIQDKQIDVMRKDTKEKFHYSPTVYQSCMNPEDIRVYDMKLQRIQKSKLQIVTKYESVTIDTRDYEFEVKSWQAVIHKPKCTQCENCGRCSW